MLANLNDKTRRVLVVDINPKKLKAFSQILRAFVTHVEARSTIGEPVQGAFDLVIADFDSSSEGERAEMLRQFEARVIPHLLLFFEGRAREDFLRIIQLPLVTHLVARTDDVDVIDFTTTVQKILKKDVFGIEKYFPWGVQPVEMRLRRSSAKAELLERATTFASSIGVHSRLTELLCTVADELFSNAIYNAPVDSQGRYRYASLPRTEEVVLDPHEEIVVKLCCDGRRLGISVADPFGSLKPEQARNYLGRCFRGGADMVEHKEGGAGLGLYYVFEALSHFVVNLSAGRRTEIIGLIDVRGGFREHRSRAKSFNFFLDESESC